jgi:hypothetical protein
MRGDAEFQALLSKMKERARVGAARHNYESARLTQDRALQNMSDLGIGLVTGRSRSLYALKAGSGAFGATGGSLAAFAGYLGWPGDVVFYPVFLNDGTVKMPARPFHDMAVETGRRFFAKEAGRVFDFALTGRWDP